MRNREPGTGNREVREYMSAASDFPAGSRFPVVFHQWSIGAYFSSFSSLLIALLFPGLIFSASCHARRASSWRSSLK